MPRKPGRPRKAAPVKKGKSTWRPAAMLDVNNKPKGYRLRWCDKDPMNIQKKEAEGWIHATSINGFKTEHEHPGKTGDGMPLTSVTEYRDMTLMAMPEEIAQARDEYIREQTERQTVELKEDLKGSLRNPNGPSAETYGKIVIE